MKTILAGLGSLVLGVAMSGSAFAQEYDQEEGAPPPPEAAVQAPQMQYGDAPPAQEAYSYPTGQWVYTANGYVWVPAGATAVAYGGAPYAYLYTPALGWRWSVSPWGWGGYRGYGYGGWAGHPAVGRGWVGHPAVGRGWGGHPAVGRGWVGHPAVGHGWGGHPAVGHGWGGPAFRGSRGGAPHAVARGGGHGGHRR